MGLPARPEVVVRVPRPLFVGQRGALDIEVTAEKETRVDFIDVRLDGKQGWRIGAGNDSISYWASVPGLVSRVMGEGVLSAGTKTFRVVFDLPPGTAPTHAVAPAWASAEISVHVSIPWWPDGRYKFLTEIRLPPPTEVRRTPMLSQIPFEPDPGEPRMEVSLASSTLVAGEAVVGSVALFHMADDKPREVEVAFVPRMTLVGKRHPFVRMGGGYTSTIEVPAGSAGQAVPFRVRLPATIAPSFSAVTHQVEWLLKVRTGSFFGKKLEMMLPLTILDRQASETAPALSAAPRLADERVLTLFDRFAQSRALTLVREELHEYPDEVPAVTRQVGELTLRIGYTYREAGTALVGRIEYPSLGLDLSVRPSAGIRDVFSKDIEIDVRDWDRAFHVDARDATQAVPFLRGALPAPGIGELVRWTDDELVIERPVGVVEESALAALLEGLLGLVPSVERARAAIAPPSGVDVDLAAWRELATRVGGQLTPGDLSFRGTLDGIAAGAELDFDVERKPVGVRVRVGEPNAASAAVREIELRFSHPSVEAPNAPTERLRALLASWPDDLRDLDIHDGIAAATVPLGRDGARVRELMAALRALLVEDSGPYR